MNAVHEDLELSVAEQAAFDEIDQQFEATDHIHDESCDHLHDHHEAAALVDHDADSHNYHEPQHHGHEHGPGHQCSDCQPAAAVEHLDTHVHDEHCGHLHNHHEAARLRDDPSHEEAHHCAREAAEQQRPSVEESERYWQQLEQSEALDVVNTITKPVMSKTAMQPEQPAAAISEKADTEVTLLRPNEAAGELPDTSLVTKTTQVVSATVAETMPQPIMELSTNAVVPNPEADELPFLFADETVPVAIESVAMQVAPSESAATPELTELPLDRVTEALLWQETPQHSGEAPTEQAGPAIMAAEIGPIALPEVPAVAATIVVEAIVSHWPRQHYTIKQPELKQTILRAVQTVEQLGDSEQMVLLREVLVMVGYQNPDELISQYIQSYGKQFLQQVLEQLSVLLNEHQFEAPRFTATLQTMFSAASDYLWAQPLGKLLLLKIMPGLGGAI